MTIFTGVTCSVTSCPFNLGERGVTCGWLTGPSKQCHHHTYREAWEAAHELEQAQATDTQAEQASFLADVEGALAPLSYGLYKSAVSGPERVR